MSQPVDSSIVSESDLAAQAQKEARAIIAEAEEQARRLLEEAERRKRAANSESDETRAAARELASNLEHSIELLTQILQELRRQVG